MNETEMEHVHSCLSGTDFLVYLQVGYLNLSALRRLDLIVAEAFKNGIRLIMVMGNFENAYGGIKWYGIFYLLEHMD